MADSGGEGERFEPESVEVLRVTAGCSCALSHDTVFAAAVASVWALVCHLVSRLGYRKLKGVL